MVGLFLLALNQPKYFEMKHVLFFFLKFQVSSAGFEAALKILKEFSRFLRILEGF